MGQTSRMNNATRQERRLTAEVAQAHQMLSALTGANLLQAPRDRFGTALVVGQHVLFHPAVDVIYQIAELKPILDPRAPTGSIQCVLVASVPMGLMAGQVHQLLVALGDLTPPQVESTEPTDPPAEPPAGPTLVQP